MPPKEELNELAVDKIEEPELSFPKKSPTRSKKKRYASG